MLPRKNLFIWWKSIARENGKAIFYGSCIMITDPAENMQTDKEMKRYACLAEPGQGSMIDTVYIPKEQVRRIQSDQ